MKKYIKPAIKVYEVKTSQILSGSLIIDKTNVEDEYGESQ